jgi:probable rRNA maturation factor
MVTIQVKRNIRLPIDKTILLSAAQTTLELTKSTIGSSLGMVIGNDRLVQKLNAKYRQVDAPTDVLSFAAGEVDPDTKDVYLGDIVISLARATEQANHEGHPVGEELQLLVVHGTLHLLGYDHESIDDRKKMQAAQDQILDQLGLKLRVTL